DFRFLEVNPAFEKLTGLKAETLIGRIYSEVQPSVGKELIEHFGKVALTGESTHFENYSATMGKYYEVTAYSPKHGQFAVIFHDITERKQVEEALRLSENRLSLVFNNNHDMQLLVSVEPEGDLRIAAVNQHYLDAARALGFDFSAQYLVGQTIEKMLRDVIGIKGDLVDLTLQRYRQPIATGLPINYEEDLETPGGHYYAEVTIIPVLNDASVCTFLLWTSHDITNLKRAEEASRAALAKYKTLFDHFPLGITVTDHVGNILESNPIAEKLLGIPQHEHNRRDIDSSEWRMVRVDRSPMPPDEYASVRALKEKRVVENVEMGILKPDDTITWLSVTAAPLPGEGEGVV
ncbi:PAS domain S-box protein, partial [bacterium]|nr:PAS domain S-box protein [bacterium]